MKILGLTNAIVSLGLAVNAQQKIPFIHQEDTLGYVEIVDQNNKAAKADFIIINKRISDSLFNEIEDLYSLYGVRYEKSIKKQIQYELKSKINTDMGNYLIQSGKLRNGSIAVVLALACVSVINPIQAAIWAVGGGISLGLQIASNNKLIKAGLASEK
jgi:glyoxylate carboligase